MCNRQAAAMRNLVAVPQQPAVLNRPCPVGPLFAGAYPGIVGNGVFVGWGGVGLLRAIGRRAGCWGG